MNTKQPNSQYDIPVVIITCVLVGYILFFGLIYVVCGHNTIYTKNEQHAPQTLRVELKDMIKVVPSDREFLNLSPAPSEDAENFPNIIDNLDMIVISGTIEELIAAVEPEMPRE